MVNENLEDLKKIPNFSRYRLQIDENGDHKVKDILKNKILKTSKQTSGYKTWSLVNDDNKRKTVYVHRLVADAFLTCDERKKYTIDHINRNCSDNRLCNLRYATRSQQQHNRREKDGGLIGTTFHKAAKKWVSYIRFEGKSHYLGLFLDRQEAHKAYLEAAEKYYPGIRYHNP